MRFPNIVDFYLLKIQDVIIKELRERFGILHS